MVKKAAIAIFSSRLTLIPKCGKINQAAPTATQYPTIILMKHSKRLWSLFCILVSLHRKDEGAITQRRLF